MLKEDDIILCTVKRVEGTTVFLEVEGNGEGSLVFSEIAAGRIRNLREYVVPNKKIVCKILRIINGHPQLSLRRVTAKERELVLEQHQKEKTFSSLIKAIVKDAESVIKKIKEKSELWKLYDEAKENIKLLESYFSKEEASKIAKIFAEKKDKEKMVKKTILLKSDAESGIKDIKSILEAKNADIRYLGSSKFSISVKGKDFKEINVILNKVLSEIQQKAKEKKTFLEIIEK